MSIFNQDKLISYLSLLERKFDIICMTETWYGDEKIAEIFFEKYISFYSNILSRKGGCQLTETLKVNADFVESVFVEVFSDKKKVRVGTVYRPPNTSFDAFYQFY